MSDKPNVPKNVQYGIFTLPLTHKKAISTELDEESYLLTDELKQRVEAQRKIFNIRALGQEWVFGLLVGQSEQILLFLQSGQLTAPRFFYIKRSSVVRVQQPDFVTAEYGRQRRTPPTVPLLAGLEFMIDWTASGYVLTCDQGVIDDDISYGSSAKEFSVAFPPVSTTPSKARAASGKSEDSSTFANLDLKPLQRGPKP